MSKSSLKDIPKCHICGSMRYQDLVNAGHIELAEELVSEGKIAEELVMCEQCGRLTCYTSETNACAEILNEDQLHCKECLSKQIKCDCNKCIASPDDCPATIWFKEDGKERWKREYDYYYACPEYLEKKDDSKFEGGKMDKGMKALNNIGAIKTKRDNQFVKYYAPKQFEIISKELSKLDEIRKIVNIVLENPNIEVTYNGFQWIKLGVILEEK